MIVNIEGEVRKIDEVKLKNKEGEALYIETKWDKGIEISKVIFDRKNGFKVGDKIKVKCRVYIKKDKNGNLSLGAWGV